jgi:putative NADH-flavin reductase
MKILVIGSTGGLGRELVLQGVAAGHDVTAMARGTPAGDIPSGVRLALGDVLDRGTLDRAVTGQDAVIVAIAPKLRLRQRTVIFSTGARNLQAAMDESGVSRLLWTTSAAVDPDNLAATGFFFSRIFEPLFLSGVYADCARSEEILSSSPLKWTFVRPSRLTDGPATSVYRVGAWQTPQGGQTISRADVAAFMLGELIANAHTRSAPTLAY